MRGTDEASGSLFSYVDLEERVPAGHPLRKIRQIVNDALASLDAEFDALYTDFGRPSIAPERLIRASLLQMLFSIRSERQLMEQMDFFGCRPLCKRLLTLLACDRVRTSFRPRYAALPEAAGRYGDQRIGSKSTMRASRSHPFSGFPAPDLFDRCAHSGRRLLTLPLAPPLVGHDTLVMPSPATDPGNPRSSSASPRSAGPSCWQARSRRAFSASRAASARPSSRSTPCDGRAQ